MYKLITSPLYLMLYRSLRWKCLLFTSETSYCEAPLWKPDCHSEQLWYLCFAPCHVCSSSSSFSLKIRKTHLTWAQPCRKSFHSHSFHICLTASSEMITSLRQMFSLKHNNISYSNNQYTPEGYHLHVDLPWVFSQFGQWYMSISGASSSSTPTQLKQQREHFLMFSKACQSWLVFRGFFLFYSWPRHKLSARDLKPERFS